MRIFLLAILSLSLSGLFAQTERCSFKTPHQTDNWLFHLNIGLKFSDEGATILPMDNKLPLNGKGTAAISDENGKLLLYTNGEFVWNGNYQKINEEAKLYGSPHSTQSSLIVPRPGSSKDYYIFTTDPPSDRNRGLNYSVIDVSLNNNQGAVTSERNISLLPGCTDMLSGVKHANGDDYWVVAHGIEGNNFYAFLVDSVGVSQTPIVKPAGTVLDGKSFGAMKISPDGKRIALASYEENALELFSFDKNTGEVKFLQQIIHDLQSFDWGPYYVEFSPDGSKLYYTIFHLQSGKANYLYQYDIEKGESVLLNDPDPPFGLDIDVTAIQLARDGKIYVARMNQSMLGVIENPNRSGLACNYNQDGLTLGLKKSQLGMPNFIQSYFDIPHFDYDTKCHGDETEFTILNTSNVESVEWTFGDGANSSEFTPKHVYSEPGSYQVRLTEKYDGSSFETLITVTIHPLPPKPLEAKGDIMYLFPGSRVPLDAGEGMFSYHWQQGSDYGTDQFFEVDQAGIIEVTVEDINCCTNSGVLEVISLAITLPNAFIPSSSEVLNQEFRAFGPSDGIENFNLKVFNIWGQMVFEAKDFNQKWDGTIKGQSAASGMYTWLLGFDIIGDLTGIGRVKYKGTVNLLR